MRRVAGGGAERGREEKLADGELEARRNRERGKKARGHKHAFLLGKKT
jgi:hypothetical protein